MALSSLILSFLKGIALYYLGNLLKNDLDNLISFLTRRPPLGGMENFSNFQTIKNTIEAIGLILKIMGIAIIIIAIISFLIICEKSGPF